jgi:hypothetical protein
MDAKLSSGRNQKHDKHVAKHVNIKASKYQNILARKVKEQIF